MRAYILSGGGCDIDALIYKPSSDGLVIAADCGYLLADKLGCEVDIFVGDRDSLDITPYAKEIVTLPPVKDETDTEAALKIAMKCGANDIIIIGGLGGRFDHSLANVFTLKKLRSSGVRAVLTDGENIVRYIENETVTVTRRGYRYYSLLSLGLSSVSEYGCKYPLDKATLTFETPYATSNEITEAQATVTVSGDGVLLIESGRQHTV